MFVAIYIGHKRFEFNLLEPAWKERSGDSSEHKWNTKSLQLFVFGLTTVAASDLSDKFVTHFKLLISAVHSRLGPFHTERKREQKWKRSKDNQK